MNTKKDIEEYVAHGEHRYKNPILVKPIYEIVLFEHVKPAYLPDGRPMGFPDTGCEDHPGFYYSLDDAIEAMHTNCCDMREYVFDAGMILCRFPGLYDCVGREGRIYFEWDAEKGGYFEAEEPEFFRVVAY